MGIDAGLVASELAELTSHGTAVGEHVRPWARGYTVAAVLLSVLLNAYAFGKMAQVAFVAAWIALGTGLALLLLTVLGVLHTRRTSYDVKVHVPGWHPERLPAS